MKAKPKPLSRSAGWIRIFFGYYEINSTGTIRRVMPGPATHPGRILKPYRPFTRRKNGTISFGSPTVKLCRLGHPSWQVTVDQLLQSVRSKFNPKQ